MCQDVVTSATTLRLSVETLRTSDYSKWSFKVAVSCWKDNGSAAEDAGDAGTQWCRLVNSGNGTGWQTLFGKE